MISSEGKHTLNALACPLFTEHHLEDSFIDRLARYLPPEHIQFTMRYLEIRCRVFVLVKWVIDKTELVQRVDSPTSVYFRLGPSSFGSTGSEMAIAVSSVSSSRFSRNPEVALFLSHPITLRQVVSTAVKSGKASARTCDVTAIVSWVTRWLLVKNDSLRMRPL